MTVVTPRSKAFKENARAALADPMLQAAMNQVGGGLAGRRKIAREALPEFDALRDTARDIKNHTLAHLDLYLERYEAKAKESGAVTLRVNSIELPAATTL